MFRVGAHGGGGPRVGLLRCAGQQPPGGLLDTPTNTIFTVLLREYGYTHRSLADEVNRISGRIFGRPGAATDRDVRRWISGAVRWPTGRYLLPLAEIFDRLPEAMGFVPRGRSSRLPRCGQGTRNP